MRRYSRALEEATGSQKRNQGWCFTGVGQGVKGPWWERR